MHRHPKGLLFVPARLKTDSTGTNTTPLWMLWLPGFLLWRTGELLIALGLVLLCSVTLT